MKGNYWRFFSGSRPRRGFTLVELLVVFVIIGILAGLLVPAIAGAVGRAREATCQAELNLISTALTSFRNANGEYPPSRILLCEDGNYTKYLQPSMGSDYQFATPSANDISTYQLAVRSLSVIRKFWPRMNLTAVSATNYPDFNGNGKMDAPYVLEGDECLVWFLGGQPVRVSQVGKAKWGMLGVSSNPFFPFPNAGSVAAARKPPMYDFKNERLVDLDGDNVPSYADSYTGDHPIAYFASYGGSYDPNDVNFDVASQGSPRSPFVESDGPGAVTPPTLSFRVPFLTKGATATGSFAVSPPPNPYTASSVMGGPAIYQQPSHYQLIASGRDGMYGVGGSYYPDEADPLVREGNPNAYNTSDLQIRQREQDNLTNFHGSRLD